MERPLVAGFCSDLGQLEKEIIISITEEGEIIWEMSKHKNMVQSSWMDFIAFNCSQQQVYYFYSLQSKKWLEPVESLSGPGRVNVMLSQAVLKSIYYIKEKKNYGIKLFSSVRRLHTYTHSLSLDGFHTVPSKNTNSFRLKIRCLVLFVWHHFLIHLAVHCTMIVLPKMCFKKQ